jgi:hypothetical protein
MRLAWVLKSGRYPRRGYDVCMFVGGERNGRHEVEVEKLGIDETKRAISVKDLKERRPSSKVLCVI